MEIKDVLTQAFQIGSKSKFNVEIIESNHIERKEMTYIELGTILISNKDSIEKISIIKKINREI